MRVQTATACHRLAAGIGLSLLAACAASRAPVDTGAPPASVRNALGGGLTGSVFFGVHSVDGAVVHDKFDRDREVALAPGERLLRLQYYAESLSASARGREECEVVIDAYPGAVFRVEGVARDGRWRAHLIDDARGSSDDCRFPDGVLWGAVEGAGEGEIAARAEAQPAAPAPQPQAVTASAPSAASAANDGAAAAVAVASPLSSADPGVAPAVPPVAVAVPPAPAAPMADAAAARRPGPAEEGTLTGIRRVLTRQMKVDWGCAAGYVRVRRLDADGTLLLKGSDRIALLGVDLRAPATLDLSDACVRLRFDDETRLAERDRDGRLLAYVFLPDGTLVNEQLLRSGAARVETGGRHRYLGAFLAAESEARAARRGIWSAD